MGGAGFVMLERRGPHVSEGARTGTKAQPPVSCLHWPDPAGSQWASGRACSPRPARDQAQVCICPLSMLDASCLVFV